MSRFNKSVSPTKTINLAGGEAYARDPKRELITLVLTTFLSDSKDNKKFYRSSEQEIEKIRELVEKLSPFFVAQLALYARTQANMRSVSHVLAGELFRLESGKTKNRVSGLNWVRRFLDKVVVRPDDALEILSYYENNVIDPSRKKVVGGFARPIPNALWGGLGRSLNKFNVYQLAKYKGESKQISLIDLVNVTHPTTEDPTRSVVVDKIEKENGESFEVREDLDKFGMVVRDLLPTPKTWETKLSEAGRVSTEGKTTAEIETEKEQNKKEAWESMVKDGSIAQFALLRNLRNIIQYTPELVDNAITMLIDPERIHNSRILPFRYLTAMQEIEKLPATAVVRQVLEGIDTAVDTATLAATPIFEGNTLIAVDTSGSMMSNNLVKISSLFAGILARVNRADVVRFATTANYLSYNSKDTATTIARKFAEAFKGGNTNYHSVFDCIGSTRYDRIIFLSDEQGWVGHTAPTGHLIEYRRKVGVNTRIYSFDLRGYGTSQFPGDDVYLVSGISDKALDMMEYLEQDKNALVHEIEKIVI